MSRTQQQPQATQHRGSSRRPRLFNTKATSHKSIQLYDCHKGTHVKDIQSQKYGAHSARFTHEELNCLYVSTPEGALPPRNITTGGENDTIRYLSLNNNQYIRYFKGIRHR
ncbi:Set1 complex component swd2 [Candida viswanathii]|uniref:Set1 complex component swd2 n=1 Tax=Candida viswanathii TaxID=5486 RepID=A0A367YL28_9ASCO|nr:Set1 complex component swd2 [Candida viswanathii]